MSSAWLEVFFVAASGGKIMIAFDDHSLSLSARTRCSRLLHELMVNGESQFVKRSEVSYRLPDFQHFDTINAPLR